MRGLGIDQAVKARVTRTYEANRNLLASIQNDELVTSPGTPTTVSKYAYRYDDLGRRSDVVYTGNAFTGGSGDHLDLWGYNARNELTGSDRYADTNPAGPDPNTAVATLDRAYTYDAIGNRTQSTTGTDATRYYCSNELNQYATIDDDSSACPPVGGADETPTYDLDGNLLTDGGKIGGSTGRTLTWDGENRLIRVEPASPGSGDIKVEFGYDYLGRRIEKTVTEWDPNTSGWSSTPSSHLRWIYYEWQPLLEMDGANSNAATKKYAWGLDLAGSGNNPMIDGVAGIGGLLAVRDVGLSKSYVYFYDGNGNVGQLVSLSDGATVAMYEYDAYGNVTAFGGSYASTNTMRFSTKPWDDETGLGNWGMRYYEPEKGRWVSRDPIEELGGFNLNTYVVNEPTGLVDAVGKEVVCDGVAIARCLALRCYPLFDRMGNYCQRMFAACRMFPYPENPACIALAGCGATFAVCAASCLYENCTSMNIPPPTITVKCKLAGSALEGEGREIGSRPPPTCHCYYNCPDGIFRHAEGNVVYRQTYHPGRGPIAAGCACAPTQTFEIPAPKPPPPPPPPPPYIPDHQCSGPSCGCPRWGGWH